MARNFDATTNLDLQAADAAVMHVVEPFAVGLWYKGTSGLVGNFKYLLSKVLLAGEHPSFGFSTNATEALRFLQGYGTSSGQLVVSPTIASATAFDGAWHYLMGSADGSNVRIYLDGVEQGTGTAQVGATVYSSGGLYVGSFDGATNSLYFNGGLAELVVFDKIPDAAERAALAKGYSPLAVKPASVVMYWPLIGKYAPEIDVVGGVNLTNNGTVQALNGPRLILRSTSPVGQPAAAGGATVQGTLDASLGGLTAAITGGRRVNAGLAASLGGLVARITGTTSGSATPTNPGGGWYKLLSIFRQQDEDARWGAERRANPVACPHCGLVLKSGPEGSGVRLYCPAGDFQLTDW
jgi:hypothetical protein